MQSSQATPLTAASLLQAPSGTNVQSDFDKIGQVDVQWQTNNLALQKLTALAPKQQMHLLWPKAWVLGSILEEYQQQSHKQ